MGKFFNIKLAGIVVFTLFSMAVAPAAFAEDILENLSTLGQSCTSRTVVSDIVPINIRIRNAASNVYVETLQYTNEQFIRTGADFALTDPSTELYTALIDTRRLNNGWLNVDVKPAPGMPGFTVFFWVVNSTTSTGAAVSVIATSSVVSSPEPTPTAAPAPEPSPTSSKPCRGKRCR